MFEVTNIVVLLRWGFESTYLIYYITNRLVRRAHVLFKCFVFAYE